MNKLFENIYKKSLKEGYFTDENDREMLIEMVRNMCYGGDDMAAETAMSYGIDEEDAEGLVYSLTQFSDEGICEWPESEEFIEEFVDAFLNW